MNLTLTSFNPFVAVLIFGVVAILLAIIFAVSRANNPRRSAHSLRAQSRARARRYAAGQHDASLFPYLGSTGLPHGVANCAGSNGHIDGPVDASSQTPGDGRSVVRGLLADAPGLGGEHGSSHTANGFDHGGFMGADATGACMGGGIDGCGFDSGGGD